MRRILAFLLILLIACSMVACSSDPNSSKSSSEGIQQKSNSDAQSTELQNEKEDTEETKSEQPSIELDLDKVDLFIEEYNKAATTPITDISEIDVTDQTSEHYRTEFRLGAFEDAYAKTGLIGDIAVDIVGYGWDKEAIRIYADDISLEQAQEIIKAASPILDTTLSESDIQDVMTDLDENQEANGYYYGDIGLLLLGKYKESYELMLKVE